ncbi:MAG: DNA repair protein RecN [Candidatus Binatia bacterium]|nr:DNA repair protein RecN [Candidatus Binatia bacterium]
MLLRLKVTNLALLEDLDLEFGSGLNIVTGETGAGKSLLQRALALAAGHRASSEVVRRGADAARIEANFQVPDDARALLARLDEIGVPVPDQELLVRRTIPRSGKARVSINDASVTLATLNEVGGVLVHLQGQHESLRLAQPEAHVEMLDAACGTLDKAEDLRSRYGALLKLIARLEAVEQGLSEHERRLELTRWELEELDEAGFLDLKEEISLTSERERLRHGEKLRATAAEALEQLDLGEQPALAALERQARRMSEMAELDSDLQEIAEGLEQAVVPLQEAVRGLQGYAESLRDDPSRLEEVEDRLALLARLERKHGVQGLEGLLQHREALAAELDAATRDAQDPEELRRELAAAADTTWKAADRLETLRRKGAKALCPPVIAELGALGMEGATFSVGFSDLPARAEKGPAQVLHRDGANLGSDGRSQIEFLLAANPGEGESPLGKVASGGELSRVMLALRNVAGGPGVPTMVFDEVDAGIGGSTAEAVGERLARLAEEHQVLCITHLAQIAAYADAHYAVAKGSRGGRTRTIVDPIEGEARKAELARMLGGGGVHAETHAAEMLRRGHEFRKKGMKAGGKSAPKKKRSRQKTA